MKQITIAVLVLILFSIPTFALNDATDLEITNIVVAPQGNVDFNADILAGGNVDVTVNGVSMSGLQNQVSSMSLTMEQKEYDTILAGSTGGGILNTITHKFVKAMQWLSGGRKGIPGEQEKAIALAMDGYFASDQDTQFLYDHIKILSMRIEALENTMDEVQKEAYCQAILDVMHKYNLRTATCGEKTFYNHMKDPLTGEDLVISIEKIE
ncbi:MAG: hypothetical protein PHG05_03670 [Candidatus Nanoarchaeia archaeon]|nr:hypothetical protein [Candidatus Nanoarchaeia archaeon]